jgi:hypothetical protein
LVWELAQQRVLLQPEALSWLDQAQTGRSESLLSLFLGLHRLVLLQTRHLALAGKQCRDCLATEH